ncbi:hypothetical protein TWF694_008020 [Orbilia ellipsospora]|uniref:MARVEL domain-containing protein n=1 Tax=Orbilia ellipsospora TaxID=2528407 RepID=A0AAV9XG35_9PEZI
MAVIAKLLSTIIRCAQVLAALFNTGVTTYFIVGLSNRNLIDGNGKALAVEIISAAGLVWAAFALLFSICLLQKSFFRFFVVLGDLIFIGGFIAVTILLKDAYSADCRNNNITVGFLQRGGSHLNVNCELIKGIFIVSIALCVLFAFTVLTAGLAQLSARKDRAYGPSPANNYTYGRGKRDITDKTNGDLQTGTTSAGREYLAPRGYAGTDATVSPVPSNTNLRNKEHSHAGQYAMAGALVGGAATAAHHHHKKGAGYGGVNDGLPNHPGPEDHTTEYIPTNAHENPERLGTMNTYGTNSAYSELDPATATPSAYDIPGAYPASRNAIPPTAYYPAATELPSSGNPHFYSSEMEAAGYNKPLPPQELGARGLEDHNEPLTPDLDRNREEVGFGYGNGPGMVGGGSNEVSTLPELGREDGRRF